MSDTPGSAGSPTVARPRDRRRAETRQEILDAAWALARTHGFGGVTMRDLGAAVGLRAQSLYAYFASKHELLDAMFRQGYEAALAVPVPDPDPARGPADRQQLLEGALAHARFCAEDPVRYQLLFQRPILDFRPSSASYALALDYLERARTRLADLGVNDPAHLDLFTALVTGIVSQQLSNEPGGDRWLGLLADAVAMFCDHIGIPAEPAPAAEKGAP
jgi:AcrR family transcriptional regulator